MANKSPEQVLRDAATAFRDALSKADKAGFAVTWPRSADGLGSLQISQTGRVKSAPAKTTKK